MTPGTALTRGRTLLATLVVAGLELAWLYALLHSVARGMRIEVSVPSLLLLYALSFVLALGLRAALRSARAAAAISWLAWPVVTLAALMILLYPDARLADASWAAVMRHALSGVIHEPEAAAFIVMAGGIVWWLGRRLGTSRMAYETVVTEFQLGLAVLTISLFIGHTVGVDQPAAIPVAVGFVGLGLLGAAATRTDDGSGLLFFRQRGTWWGMLLIGVSLVLLLGLLAGALFTPELMQIIIRGIRGLWELIERLFSAIAGLFSSGSEAEVPPGLEVPPMPESEGNGGSWGLPEWLSRPLRFVYGILVAGVLILAAWRIASQLFGWMRRRAGRAGVQLESLPGAFRLDLATLFRRLFAWAKKLLTFGGSHRRSHDEPAPTTSVRRLYADMLRWGAKSGFPRGPSETPCEYQRTLCAALPAYRADVSLITAGYVRARYGAEPPSETEIHELRESRRRLTRRAARGARRGRKAGE